MTRIIISTSSNLRIHTMSKVCKTRTTQDSFSGKTFFKAVKDVDYFTVIIVLSVKV